MEYRHLGSSGLNVSALSLGAWITYGGTTDEDTSYRCMVAAYERGVNFFDNAEAYAQGNAELVMGRVLQRAGWKRSDFVVATKLYWGGPGPNDRGLSRKHIVEGTDASLRRLQLEYVDLLFCHRPDSETPIEETVRAMNHVIDQGKVFYWGTSEWSAAEIREAHDVARREHLIPPQMEQPQYNMFHRHRVEVEYARLYGEIGLGTTIWSPLAGGLLSGKYNAGVPAGSRGATTNMDWLKERFTNAEAQQRIEKVRRLAPIAGRLECSLAQLALAWCLKNPHVSSVITGATRPEQVAENMGALDVLPRLDGSTMREIEAVLDNRPEPELNWRYR